MCKTCGCSDGNSVRVTDLETNATIVLDAPNSHAHEHGGHAYDHHHHDHEHHHHDHGHGSTTIELQEAILARNDALAERNRGWFAGRGILALNLVSSPGAGKTTLLERTIRDLGADLNFAVIEGDQETTNDAQRIRATGCRAVQVNTGTGCHLDAMMVGEGLRQLNPPSASLVLIENVGNLVCPALFDLGEHAKVLIASVTEGEDKPLKYPHMFRVARLVLLNKIDLLPHVSFDVARFQMYANEVNPRLPVVPISATHGDGLADWYAWLKGQHSAQAS